MAFRLSMVLAAVAITGCSQPTDEVGRDAAALDDPQRPVSQMKMAAEGPFGIQEGMTFEELGIDRTSYDGETGIVILNDIPSPSGQFPMVGVKIYPDTGVCAIIARSNNFDSDTRGSKVRGFMDNISESLKEKYGTYQKTDSCYGYCNPQFWLQQIDGSDRFYFYEWKNTEENPLPYKISSIEMSAQNPEYNDSDTQIIYTFSNQAACEKAGNKAAAVNL